MHLMSVFIMRTVEAFKVKCVCVCVCVCVCRYGLGMIYYKQEKFNLAEIHFKKALSINPQSSVLLCHIGVVS